MHVAIVTAGGAGMFCGSCMQDNTLARGLIDAGARVTLIPTYTPIRGDEPNQSQSRVFFGGINVYLNAKSKLWAGLPTWSKSWLDSPWVIQQLTQFGVSNDAAELGDLTLKMLAGGDGPLREAGEELARFIGRELKPDIVVFSNALLSGCLPQIRHEFGGPIVCVLQGDDVFLDGLPDSHRTAAIAAVSERANGFDGFLTHSNFYRDRMAAMLSLPIERFQTIPLSIDLEPHVGKPGERASHPFTIGYFARLAPEKGLHHLIDAFEYLKGMHPDARLRIGGYEPGQHRSYIRAQKNRLAKFGSDVQFVGSPDSIDEKVAFYRSIDVLSVPSDFEEPKGLSVLEAWANGVPVVQPAAGAFPELIGHHGEGGLLVPHRDARELAEAWSRLYRDQDERLRLAESGHRKVRDRHSHAAAAKEALRVLRGIRRKDR
ncbi:MAG: glycosyltransferase family 4 protein [Planctomycetaceae bacterium]